MKFHEEAFDNDVEAYDQLGKIDPSWVEDYNNKEEDIIARENQRVKDHTPDHSVEIDNSKTMINGAKRMAYKSKNGAKVASMSEMGFTYFDKPMIDYETTNKTFFYMHQMLEGIKVENNTFMLQLFDRGLVGVDPRDPELSDEMKERITLECLRNPMYVIREVTVVSVQGGTKKFELHPGNLAMLYLLLNNCNFYLEQPRQTYKTGSLMIFYAMIYNFGGSNSGMMLTHHRKSDANNNLGSILETIDGYPDYLNFLKEYNAKGKALKLKKGREFHVHPISNSKIDAVAPGTDPKSAYNKGRGKTLNICNFDEFGFIPYIDIFYAAAIPAFGTAMENARANKLKYGIHITSTPPDVNTREGAFSHRFVKNCVDFIPKMYDMTREELHEYISCNSKNGFVFCSFQWHDLGLTKKWLDEKLTALNGDYVSFRREYLLEWIVDLSGSPFDEEDLNEIKFHIGDGEFFPHLVDKKWQCKFMIPVSEFIQRYSVRPRSLITGIDFATGLGRDSSAIVVLDADTSDVVMTFCNNKIGLDDFTDLLVLLHRTLLVNSLMIPEANAYGESFISRIRSKEKQMLPRLYYGFKKSASKRDGLQNKESAFKYGFNQDKTSREQVYDKLKTRVEKHKKRFKSKELYEQITNLITTRAGRIDHKPGMHDDLVMAYNIAMFVLTDESINISKFGYTRLIESSLLDGIEEKKVKTYEDLYSEEAINELEVQGSFEADRRKFVKAIVDSNGDSANEDGPDMSEFDDMYQEADQNTFFDTW